MAKSVPQIKSKRKSPPAKRSKPGKHTLKESSRNKKQRQADFDILQNEELLESLEHTPSKSRMSFIEDYSRSQIIASYTQPIRHKRIGGIRWWLYSLLIIGFLSFAVISLRFKPESFGIISEVFTEPAMLEDQISFVYLDRFSFSQLKLPVDGSVVHDDKLVLEGWIKPGIVFEINGLEVERDEDGFYTETVKLQEGSNNFLFEVSSKNQVEQTSRLVIYQKIETLNDLLINVDPDASSDADIPLRLKINAWPGSIAVQIGIDKGPWQDYVLGSGMSGIWKAEQQIAVRTDNARSTFIILNDGLTGSLMGSTDEPGERVYTLEDLD